MTPRSRVLVTGAGGFVGCNIVQVLLDAGRNVIALDRAFDMDLRGRWAAYSDSQLTLIEAETSRLPEFAVDGVIHGAALTASPADTHQTPEAHMRANLDPLLDVLEWAGRHGTGRVIVLSSDAVFRSSEPGPITETAQPAPLGLYAVAKVTAEQLCETLRSQYQRDVVAVRLGNIYGPQERIRQTRPRVSLVARMVNEALQHGVLTSYRQDAAHDWTYAPDVGRALLALLEAPTLQHHLYHVASEQLFAPLDIARAIKAILPGTDLHICAGVGPDSRPDTRHGHLSSTRLRQELNFDHWTPFTEGLESVIDWQRMETVQ